MSVSSIISFVMSTAIPAILGLFGYKKAQAPAPTTDPSPVTLEGEAVQAQTILAQEQAQDAGRKASDAAGAQAQAETNAQLSAVAGPGGVSIDPNAPGSAQVLAGDIGDRA